MGFLEGFIPSDLTNRQIKKWYKVHKVIDGIDHKLCNYCSEYFPSTLDYFYKNKRNGIDGLHPNCKKCAYYKMRNWIRDNPEGYARLKKRRIEIDDPMRLIRSREAAERNRKEGYQKRWRQENRDKLKSYNENRKQNKTHEISKDEWEECLLFFETSCAYCGIHQDEAKNEYGQCLHKEHVYHDGSNKIDNCVPACRSCNSRKWTYEFEYWYQEGLDVFDENRLVKIKQWLSIQHKEDFDGKTSD